MSDVTLTLKLNEQASAQLNKAVFDATQDYFELDFKPAAKDLSPVRTGYNRNTIDADVRQTATGVEAEGFTQSGYGGYLEVGTRHMAAQPYMWLAFQQTSDRLRDKIKGLIGGRR